MFSCSGSSLSCVYTWSEILNHRYCWEYRIFVVVALQVRIKRCYQPLSTTTFKSTLIFIFLIFQSCIALSRKLELRFNLKVSIVGFNNFIPYIYQNNNESSHCCWGSTQLLLLLIFAHITKRHTLAACDAHQNTANCSVPWLLSPGHFICLFDAPSVCYRHQMIQHSWCVLHCNSLEHFPTFSFTISAVTPVLSWNVKSHTSKEVFLYLITNNKDLLLFCREQ